MHCPRCSGSELKLKKDTGSTSFVPPVAGLMIAGEVIRELASITPGK